MNLHQASVADVLRCTQRDQAFIDDLESKLHSFLKFFGAPVYHKISRLVPSVANVWYYYMTSLGNLQTLGEEYTGIVRFTNGQQTPSGLTQLIWLILYIGGEPLLDRALAYTEMQVVQSLSLRQQAKDMLLKLIRIFRSEKLIFKRIHHSFFYINRKYYYIANRLTGIKYVLLRDWFQNDSFSGTFKLLGELTLFYILFNTVQKVFFNDNLSVGNARISEKSAESSKNCILCADKLKSPTATPCGHIFCWDCLCDSLNYQRSCPLCRMEVEPNRIIFLQNYL
ncbi:peroxisome biogenesis factor 10-like [Euwallacea similis]|uniref:peroxisome biogenesis factor 10-like n=1 Tax=Euwallacea similis TaxID=1736056 RepID=UPI003451030D